MHYAGSLDSVAIHPSRRFRKFCYDESQCKALCDGCQVCSSEGEATRDTSPLNFIFFNNGHTKLSLWGCLLVRRVFCQSLQKETTRRALQLYIISLNLLDSCGREVLYTLTQALRKACSKGLAGGFAYCLAGSTPNNMNVYTYDYIYIYICLSCLYLVHSVIFNLIGIRETTRKGLTVIHYFVKPVGLICGREALLYNSAGFAKGLLGGLGGRLCILHCGQYPNQYECIHT